MIEEQRAWLIKHLHEGHGLPGPDEAYESFADLKAAHDLLHESAKEAVEELQDDGATQG